MPRGRPKIYAGDRLVRISICIRSSTFDNLKTLAAIRAQREGGIASLSLAADLVLSAGLEKINQMRNTK